MAPGLVDLHTHLREPGGEIAETVESGTRAAAVGGYTAVVAMPNTEPAIDNASIVRDVLALGRTALAEVAVAAAITVGRAGKNARPRWARSPPSASTCSPTTAAACRTPASCAGRSSTPATSASCSPSTARTPPSPVAVTCTRALGRAVSASPGQPAVAEEAMLARDIALVRETGAPMHFLHLSTAVSAELVRRAKADGLPVTAEVTPHHLVLTDAAVAGYDTAFKVESAAPHRPDTEALRAALVEGVVDAVATDHAPHATVDKEEPFDFAPFGMTGLETSLALLHTIPVPTGGVGPVGRGR